MAPRPSRPLSDLWLRAFTRPGADPLPVRDVLGAVRFGEVGTSCDFLKSGQYADPEAAVSARVEDLDVTYVARLKAAEFMRQASAVRIFAVFLDGDGNPVADPNPPTMSLISYRLQTNGFLVKADGGVNLSHLAEQRDGDVCGRPTLYVVSNVNDFMAVASNVRIYVASETTGYDVEEP